MNNQDIIRKKIKEIQNDNNLTIIEKNTKIFNLMNSANSSKQEENNKILDCKHYERGCIIYADCCNKYYSCRICHDEEVNGHTLDSRKDVNKIRCKVCNTEQGVSNRCINVECNIEFGKYYCEVCRLWENREEIYKDIYHCEKCNICRKGPKENYYHCDNCNACINKSIKDTHKCLKDAFLTDCPICFESLFFSNNPVTTLKCGHNIHVKCLTEYIESNEYKCPLCKKSIGDMKYLWDQMRAVCSIQKTPDEYKNWKSLIFCNDCEQRCTVDYHLLSHECQICKGYNTNVIEIIKPMQEEEQIQNNESNESSESSGITEDSNITDMSIDTDNSSIDLEEEIFGIDIDDI